MIMQAGALRNELQDMNKTIPFALRRRLVNTSSTFKWVQVDGRVSAGICAAAGLSSCSWWELCIHMSASINHCDISLTPDGAGQHMHVVLTGPRIL